MFVSLHSYTSCIFAGGGGGGGILVSLKMINQDQFRRLSPFPIWHVPLKMSVLPSLIIGIAWDLSLLRVKLSD